VIGREKEQCLVLACCFLGNCMVAAQSSPNVTYQLRTRDFETSNSAQLLVTAEVPATSLRIDIQFVAPPGFVVDPNSLRFEPQPGKRIVAVSVRRMADVGTSEYSLLVRATVQPAGNGSPFSVDQAVTFTYTRRLEVKVYFMLGLAGFVLGYFLRIVTAVLKIIPAPAPVVLGASGGTGTARDGPVTVFVKGHYYLVDFLVSLVLAFIVLLYLMKEGHPPDSAAVWSGALLTGIGLGFLTNNDLLARIKV
jgi:hypothetical protein